MRTTRLIPIVVLCAAAAFGSRPARAQSQAEASQHDPVRARQLTDRSLDLLHKGEDCTSPAEKMAAYVEGERLANEAVTLDDNSADAHFALFANRGRRLLGEGVGANPIKLWELNQELDRCLALNPQHSDALAARGGLYRQLPRLLGGSLEKAEHYLTQSVSLDPSAVGARIELALVYRELGKPDRAAMLLRDAAYWAEQLGKQRQLKEARSLLAEVSAK